MVGIIKIKKLDTSLIRRDADNFSLSPKQIADFQKQELGIRALKPSIYGGTPSVNINSKTGEAWLVIEADFDNKISEEKAITDILKLEEKAISSVKLVHENMQPGNSVQVILPGGVHVDDSKNKYDVQELVGDNDQLSVSKHSSELTQLIMIQQILKERDIEICGQKFMSPGPYSTDFLVDKGELAKQRRKIIVHGWHEKKGFDVKMLDEEKDKLLDVKVGWSEDILRDKKHLELIKHLLYNDRRFIQVACDINTKYSSNKTNRDKQIADFIMVNEIIDDGLGYPADAPKIWSK